MQDQCNRLISNDEMNDLLDLNHRKQQEIILNYPYHRDWIKKAIKDIQIGSRIAFGVYDSGDLIGSVVIKNGLSRDLELKNFIVEKNNSEYDSEEVRDKLLAHVEDFGKRNDYDLCSIDIVTNQMDELNYFLNRGFTISYLKQYPKKDTLNLYSLTKELEQAYNDDPLSFKKMIEWLLLFRFNFDELKGGNYQEVTDTPDVSLYKYSFKINSNNLSPKYHLIGEAIICNELHAKGFKKYSNKEKLINNHFSGRSVVKLLFYSSKTLKIISKNNNWTSYNLKDVFSLLGKSNTNRIPFNSNDVGGSIFYMNDFLKRLLFSNKLKIFDAKALNYVLYLTEAFVEELDDGDDIYFCEINSSSQPILKAKSRVMSIHNYSIGNVQKRFHEKKETPKGLSKLLSDYHDPYGKDDWIFETSFIKTNSSKKNNDYKIWVLCLKKLELPDLNDNGDLNILHCLNRSSKLYVERQIKDSFAMSTYIDIQSVKKINNAFFKNSDNTSGPKLKTN